MQLLRIKHWVKNVFVIAPVIFARRFFDLPSLSLSLLAFLSFCLISSAVYILNDIKDKECDMNHPKKKERPIASGRVSPGIAVLIGAVAMFCSLWLGVNLGPEFTWCLVIYAVVNVFYTFMGKHIAIIDVFCIAASFSLRVLGGSYGIASEPSGWLIVTTFFLSLFLGFGKRRGEMLSLEENSINHREVLLSYDVSFLNSIIVSTGTVSIVLYALYTLDRVVIEQIGTEKLIYSVPFVTYGIFRYILLMSKRKDADPTDLVLHDAGMILSVSLWFIVVVLVIYFWR